MIDLKHVDLSKIDMTTDALFIKTAKKQEKIQDILSEIKKSKNDGSTKLKRNPLNYSTSSVSYTDSLSFYYDMYESFTSPTHNWDQTNRYTYSTYFVPSSSTSRSLSFISTIDDVNSDGIRYINLLDYVVNSENTDDDKHDLKSLIRNNKLGIMSSDDFLISSMQQAKYYRINKEDNIINNIKQMSERFKNRYSMKYVDEVVIELPDEVIKDVRMDRYMGRIIKSNKFYAQLFPLGETSRFNDIEFDFKMELAEEKFNMMVQL